MTCNCTTTLMEQHTSTRPVEAPQLKFGPILQSCIECMYIRSPSYHNYISCLHMTPFIDQVRICCIVHSKLMGILCMHMCLQMYVWVIMRDIGCSMHAAPTLGAELYMASLTKSSDQHVTYYNCLRTEDE